MSQNEMLRHIIRQNDLILRQQGMVLDLAGFTLERTFQMANEVETLVADVEAQTTVEAGMKVTIDHTVDLLDDIGAALKEAGTDKAKLDALHTKITGNSADLTAAEEKLKAAALRNTPFDPSAA